MLNEIWIWNLVWNEKNRKYTKSSLKITILTVDTRIKIIWYSIGEILSDKIR